MAKGVLGGGKGEGEFDFHFLLDLLTIERSGGRHRRRRRVRCRRRGSMLQDLHLSGHLGDFLREEELLVLDGHETLLQKLVLLFDGGLLAFELLDFLSLALSG